MKGELFRLPPVRLMLLLFAVFSLSVMGMAGPQDVLDKTKDMIILEPADQIEDAFDDDDQDLDDRDKGGCPNQDPSSCGQKPASTCGQAQKSTCGEAQKSTCGEARMKPTCGQTSAASDESCNTVKLDTLLENPEHYMGKTVTIDAELHRIFNDRVFTLEDDDFFRDDDILVISNVPSCEVIVPLEDEVKPGKNVRVTGVVRPNCRGDLECKYGPLDLESREGHSFTKGPVLIIEKAPAAAAYVAPPVVRLKPTPTPAPEPQPAPPVEPIVELPKTGSGLPLTALSGLLALTAACGFRFYRK